MRNRRGKQARRRQICLAAMALALAAQKAAPESVLIRAGQVVDPERGAAAANQTILIEDGKIKEIGPSVTAPAGAQTVDLSQATVLPGLIDAHTHLCATIGHPAGETPRDLFGALLLTVTSNSTGYRAIQGVAGARAMLEAGFTTVRDVGNAAQYADTDLRRAIEEGLVPGPTIVNAGRIISPMGGQFPSRVPPWMQVLFGLDSAPFIGVLPAERPGLANPEYFYADTPDELRKAVRENILYGARVIKVVVDDQPYVYSAEDLRLVVREAAQAGLKVAAHCLTDQGATHAAEAGVASIEHGWLMGEESLRIAKKNGVVLVGTDFPPQAAEALGMPPEFQEMLKARLGRARKVGVEMAFGTDIFFAPPGYTRGTLAISYLPVYTGAGMTPGEVLRMLTTNAARLLGVEGQRGALRPGLAADLIATRGNPLQEVGALREVIFVMKDGKIVKGPGP